jgi:ABC-type nitrate/sulfonate/bicarbonate transport system substrate-binding protein
MALAKVEEITSLSDLKQDPPAKPAPRPVKTLVQLEIVVVKLFDARIITDTKGYYPDQLLDLSDARFWGFEVENSTNQSVACDLIGSGSSIPIAGIITSTIATVAAGTRQPITSVAWMPYVGIRITFSSAPSSGKITVTAWKQRYRPS